MEEQMSPVGNEPEKKKSNTTLIIVIVAVVVLCCCCLGIWAAWTYGDAIVQSMNF